MAEVLPEPLVPVDTDLRDFPYMPLDVVRLRDSGLSAAPDGEVFRACVLSWCVSWHQVPAASLPDDDADLAWLLGYGRDVRGWKKLRSTGALRGWIKCSDGRLYHPTVAEKALEASQKRRSAKAKGMAGASKRWQKMDSADDAPAKAQLMPADSKGREGKGEEGNKQVPEDKSSGRLTAPLPAQLPLETNGHKAGNHAGGKPDWWPVRDRFGRITSEITEKIVFDVGKAVLGKSSGGVITKARKAWSYKREDRDRTVLEFLLVADEKSDPPSWFAATLRKAELDESPSAPHEQFPQNEYRA